MAPLALKKSRGTKRHRRIVLAGVQPRRQRRSANKREMAPVIRRAKPKKTKMRVPCKTRDDGLFHSRTAIRLAGEDEGQDNEREEDKPAGDHAEGREAVEAGFHGHGIGLGRALRHERRQ